MKPQFFSRMVGTLAMVMWLTSGAPHAAEPTTPSDPETLEEFDIAKGGDVIILPVTIANKQYPFVLNLAGLQTIVDDRLRAVLGDPLQPAAGAARPGARVQFSAAVMKVGSQKFAPDTAVVLHEMGTFPEELGYDIYGILGLDFLYGRVVQIDFDQGKFRVLAPRRVRPSDENVRVVFSPLASRPFDVNRIKLQLPGRARIDFFKVNTLDPYSIGAVPELMDLLIDDGLVAARRAFYDRNHRGSQLVLRAGMIESVGLKDITHRHLSVYEARANCVGMSYLSRFRLTVSFAEGQECILFTPGARFDAPDASDWSGMALILKDGTVQVKTVLPNFPAAQGGIERGDVIVEVDANDPRKFSLFQIRRLFMERNQVQVKFRRPGRDGQPASDFAVTLKPAKQVPPEPATANAAIREKK